MKLKNIFNSMGFSGQLGKLGTIIDGLISDVSAGKSAITNHETMLGALETKADGTDEKITLLSRTIIGDMALVIDPAETEIGEGTQNSEIKQSQSYSISGKVTQAGTVNMIVTATNFEKTVTVSLTADMDAEDIAGAIEAALAEDADIAELFDVSIDSETEYLCIEKLDADIDDPDMLVAAEIDTATFETDDPFSFDLVAEIDGQIYSREVNIKLVDSDYNVHTWFNSELSLTASCESEEGEVRQYPETVQMKNGQATVRIYMKGPFAEGDTNTLTVSDLELLGYTIDGATSVETTIADAE